MANLRDFNVEGDVGLEDFNEQEEQPPLLNEATAKTLASKAAALSGQQLAVESYEQIAREFEQGPSSPTLDRVLEAGDTVNKNTDLQVLENMLTDPNTSPEEKEKYFKAYNTIGVGKRGLAALNTNLAQAAAVQGSPDASEEADKSFLDITSTLDEVDLYNNHINQEVDAIHKAADPTWLDTTGDFVELFIPFMEGAALAELEANLGKRDAGSVLRSLTLLGESKALLRDAIQKMPFEDRRKVADYLVNAVKESGGSLVTNENTLNQVIQLQDFLVSGSYSDGDRLLDNIFSVMDSTIVLAPISKGFKNVGKAVSKARGGEITASEAATARRAQEALDRIEAEGIGEETKQILNEYESTIKAEESQVIPEDVTSATKEIVEKKVLENIPQELKDEVVKVVDDAFEANKSAPSSQVLDKQITDGVKNILNQAHLKGIDKQVFDESTRIIKENLNKSHARRMAARTEVNHTSISQIYKDTNPSMARELHDAMVSDPKGEYARVGYGTTKTDAVANDVLPEIGGAGGVVRHKISFDEASPNPDMNVIERINQRGDIHFSPNEKAAMRDAVKSDFDDVKGVNPRTEMSTIEDVPTGVKFSMVYGPRDGGFSNGSVAKEQILAGLRKYGVKDEEVEVLVRNEQGNFEPALDLNEEGVYLARVNYNYEFSPSDVVEYTLTSNDKFWRMFDSLRPISSGEAGGAAQHFIPSSTVIDKLLLDAASVASDKQSRISRILLEQGSEYADKIKSLPKAEKARVEQYIIEANNKGLKFNTTKLKARGMGEAAIDALRSWKKVNDTLWYLENRDLNRTMRARGFERFVSVDKGFDLIVRKAPANRTSFKAYDPDIDAIRSFDPAEVEVIREQGGDFYIPRDEDIKVGDEYLEAIYSNNRGSNSYVKAIRDEDNTLNYRHGHYTVRYTNPYFIEKTITKSNGDKVKSVVATSADRKSADKELSRLQSTLKRGERAEFKVRGDLKKRHDDRNDLEWSFTSFSGRTSQKVRGKRLKDVSHNQNDLAHAHIETPDESLVRSIRALSNRVSHRDFIETSKQRFVNQFKHLLKEEKGQTLWPEDIREIGKGNITTNKGELADARSTWRYITSIEKGFVNVLDDATKSFFNEMSNAAGKKGWGWLEATARKGEDASPMGFGRKAAFKLLLASNPLRQLPVQSMQALPTILGTNPLAIGKIPFQMSVITAMKMGTSVKSIAKSGVGKLAGWTEDEMIEMFKNYRAYGAEDAVQAHTLIRNQMEALIAHTPTQLIKNRVNAPLDVLQKVGFEAGETMLMRSIWLSEYDLLRKSGKKIDAEALENLQARVRHLTFNMNRAGELPYNENALSIAMQFFQAPHKAFSTILMGHKGLTGWDRLKLATAYITTFGIGGSFVTDMVRQVVPEEHMAAVEGGAFNVLMNNALGSLYGEEVGIDFSDSLRLLEFPNFYKAMIAFAETDVTALLTDNPALGLVIGNNPRVTEFVKTLARPFTPQNEGTHQEMINISKAFFEMFSGGSNYFKANYALTRHQHMSSSGKIVDDDVNTIEAWAKLAGFATVDEMKYYATQEKLYKAGREPYDDVRKAVTEVSKHLAHKGISNEDTEFYLEAFAQLQVVFENDPFYMRIIQTELLKKAEKGDFEIFNAVMRLVPFTDKKELESIIQTSTMTEQEKQTLRRTFEIMQ